MDALFDWLEENEGVKTAAYAVGIGLVVRLLWHHSGIGQSQPMFGNRQPQPNTGNQFNPHNRNNWQIKAPLQRGIAGTKTTLETMAFFVQRDHSDPFVRALAVEIVRQCPGHGFKCEVESLFRFVRDFITYRRDPYDCEMVQDARRCVFNRAGDCDDKAILFATLAASVGHRVRFGLLSNKRDDYSHVFVELYANGKWIPFDPSQEKFIPGQKGMALYEGHFNIFQG